MGRTILIVLFSLLTLFVSIYAMEQDNTSSQLLTWDIQGTYFANYASQFRPKLQNISVVN